MHPHWASTGGVQYNFFTAQVRGHIWFVLLGHVSGMLQRIQEKQRSYWEVTADCLGG